MGKRRDFGSIRVLKSGKFQASYIGHSGQRVNAPITFRTKTDARAWLTNVERDISKGVLLDSKLGRTEFREYAGEYLERSEIGDKWRETCTRNLRLHLKPLLALPIAAITPATVRRWHEAALAGKGGRVSIAQSYRFMRAVLNQAIRDEAILRNPCQVPGAGADRAKERKPASPEKLKALIAAIEDRYRAPVLIAAWCSLRRSELLNLKPGDVDTEHAVIHIRDSKSEAGKRSVAIPPHVITDLEEHARNWANTKWYCVGPRGNQQLSKDTFYGAFVRARNRVGLPHLTIHDLRHTGNTLAANAGATVRDLMHRLGHATESMARRYMHVVEGRDDEVAKALSKLAEHGDASKLPGFRGEVAR